jgi:hypothetical protein
MQPHQKKHIDIDAPVSLGGLFTCDDDSDPEEGQAFEQNFEEQDIMIGDITLIIRQYSWHMANANKGCKLCLIEYNMLIYLTVSVAGNF